MRLLLLAIFAVAAVVLIACTESPGIDSYRCIAQYDPPAGWNELTIWTNEAELRDGWVHFTRAEVDFPGRQNGGSKIGNASRGIIDIAIPNDEFLTWEKDCILPLKELP